MMIMIVCDNNGHKTKSAQRGTMYKYQNGITSVEIKQKQKREREPRTDK